MGSRDDQTRPRTNLGANSISQTMQLENRTQVMAGLTADFNEAIAAFIERRTATVEKSSGHIPTRNMSSVSKGG